MNKIVGQLIEEGGARWARRDRARSPVLIALSLNPQTIFELTLEGGASHPFWTVRERQPTDDERRGLFGLYGSPFARDDTLLLIGEGRAARRRAFVCNTREIDRWLPSVEYVRVQITPEAKATEGR